jgi:hypothetical protein
VKCVENYQEELFVEESESLQIPRESLCINC